MFDIGAVLQAPMQDQAWLKKCLLMGLVSAALCLIPIVGVLLASCNALGWMRVYAEGRMRGDEELPAVGLGYLGAGGRIVLMYLPLALIAVVVMGAVGSSVPIDLTGGPEAMVLSLTRFITATTLVTVPFSLWLTVFNPAILYLHIVKNEAWASLKLGRQWRLVTATGMQYFLFVVALLVAGIVSQLGVLVCVVGLLLTAPFGLAMQGAAVAEMARATRSAG
jgi:hypothetical protein